MLGVGADALVTRMRGLAGRRGDTEPVIGGGDLEGRDFDRPVRLNPLWRWRDRYIPLQEVARGTIYERPRSQHDGCRRPDCRDRRDEAGEPEYAAFRDQGGGDHGEQHDWKQPA